MKIFITKKTCYKSNAYYTKRYIKSHGKNIVISQRHLSKEMLNHGVDHLVTNDYYCFHVEYRQNEGKFLRSVM